MPKITLKCDQCGETIEKWPSRVKKSKHHFCSSECQYEWAEEAFRGENNPMYGKHLSEEIRRKMSGSHKGKHLSKEHRRKISEAMSGENNPNYGNHLSEETLRTLYWDKGLSQRKIAKRLDVSNGTIHTWMVRFNIPRRSRSEALKGKHHSKETRRKLSESHKGKKGYWEGKHHSKETRRKISESLKGENAPWYGKHLTEETKRKISEVNKGTNKGENNPAWNGGSSFEPYPLEFNDELREQIRTRDNYTCQMCGESGKQVHHIDYDKENNDPSNLITLCHSCHSKTNFNRDQWILYFNDLMALGVLKND